MACPSNRFVLVSSLKCGSQNPWSELFVPYAGELAFSLFAAGHLKNFLEDAPADLLDGFLALKDRSGIDVHVFFHPLVQGGVGRDFDARSGFAAINTPAASREDAHIATAGDQSSHAHRVIAGCVHETKAEGRNGFGVMVHGGEWR